MSLSSLKEKAQKPPSALKRLAQDSMLIDLFADPSFRETLEKPTKYFEAHKDEVHACWANVEAGMFGKSADSATNLGGTGRNADLFGATVKKFSSVSVGCLALVLEKCNAMISTVLVVLKAKEPERAYKEHVEHICEAIFGVKCTDGIHSIQKYYGDTTLVLLQRARELHGDPTCNPRYHRSRGAEKTMKKPIPVN